MGGITDCVGFTFSEYFNHHEAVDSEPGDLLVASSQVGILSKEYDKFKFNIMGND